MPRLSAFFHGLVAVLSEMLLRGRELPRSLKSLHNHYHCPFCQVGYDAVLDEYIAVAFTVSPNIRKIQFHDPDQLSAWDKTAEGLLPDGQPL